MDSMKLKEAIAEKEELITSLKMEIKKVIVGQDYMVERILIALFTGGHILLEGVPGLAKSLVASTVAKITGVDFKRIQFTPDLLPADILGTEIYNQKRAEFIIKQGPIFSNIVLADEINRAPAKVQSALLQAMQEKEVTIGDITYSLQRPFLVIATQNPLEQHGTYALPEAQQDRFMMKLKVDYPTKNEERNIIDRFAGQKEVDDISLEEILNGESIFTIRRIIDNIYLDDNLKEYILDIIFKSREKSEYISCGASPRGSLNLLLVAKGRAFLQGRDYVLPDDIKAVVYDVLRHRISLTYQAEAENIKVEELIANILESINLP